MPTEIRTSGTGGNDNPDPTPPTTEQPIGSFTYTVTTIVNGKPVTKKYTKTNIEWRDAWDTFTDTQKEQIRKALINSGYFEPTLTLATAKTAWSDITLWAAQEANASDLGSKWNLNDNLGGMGAGVGQQPNAYLTYGTVLTKPQDTTGETQSRKNAYLELKQFIYDNGIVLSEKGLQDYAKLVGMKPKDIVVLQDGKKTGETILQDLAKKVGFGKDGSATTVDAVKQYLRNTYVLPKYAGFADEIKAGYDIRDIANDYIQMVAQNLELDPNSIDLNDSIIQQALRPAKNKDGSFAYISYTDFQNNVKKDARWATTKNAKASMSDLAAKIQNAFGF
ncbi:MAG: hypothetical protein EBT07_04825 [Actinobacteria bacterium]|nr:hypothetical protein [Actinomycetota bacterium]